MGKPTFGEYIRRERIRAGLSLRKTAKLIGVSAVFLGEVERGVRKKLTEEHWPELIKHIPQLTLDGLTRHAAQSAPLQLDLTEAPLRYQDLGTALARRLEQRNLSDADFDTLFDVLNAGGKRG